MKSRARGLFISAFASALISTACAKEHGPAAQSLPPAADSGSAGPEADGGVPAADAPARVGGKALANLEPTVATSSEDQAPINGEAYFSESPEGVDLLIRMRGCAFRKQYPLYIQEGGDCSDETLLGPRWDSPRGEDLAPIACTGTSSVGRSFYSRSREADDARWTIGSPAESNILGHALVLYDPETLAPLACGVIGREADVPPVTKEQLAAGPSTATRAAIGGMCLFDSFVRDNRQACPDRDQLVDCAALHCDLDVCVNTCASYAACLDQAEEPCSLAYTCEIDTDCSVCQGNVTQCVTGFCPDVIACAAPVTPDGPCSQLKACCAMQGEDAASCLDLVNALEKFSGDPSCKGAMHDWDINTHLKVPCQYE